MSCRCSMIPQWDAVDVSDFIPILMIFIMSNYIKAIEYDFQFEILVDKGPAEHLFSHGQMLSMYFLGLASLFCILFSYKKLQQNFRLSTELSLLEINKSAGGILIESPLVTASTEEKHQVFKYML